MSPLRYHQSQTGSLEFTLTLSSLYPSQEDRRLFEIRFRQFVDSDGHAQKIFQLHGDTLAYRSEQLIPRIKDERMPLLMVFGNPASHSVDAGMFFSFEGSGREHRFWKDIMRPTGLFDIPVNRALSPSEQNNLRKKTLLELTYDSPFRLGLCVFISLPSPASGPWSGIAGVRRLLGSGAMKKLVPFERQRVFEASRDFLTPKGVAVTFQKDAWEGLRSEKDPAYGIGRAKSGKLRGSLKNMPRVSLLGVPPTRLAGPCREALSRLLPVT